MQNISFIKQTVSEEKIFKDFFRKFVLFWAPATNQNEGHLKRRALLNKIFSKNKTQISPMRKQKFAISTFSIISLWNVYVAMATRVLIRSEQQKKKTFLVSPSCGCFMPNIKSFGHTASEEMSFEIVDDDGQTTDGRQI